MTDRLEAIQREEPAASSQEPPAVSENEKAEKENAEPAFDPRTSPAGHMTPEAVKQGGRDLATAVDHWLAQWSSHVFDLAKKPQERRKPRPEPFGTELLDAWRDALAASPKGALWLSSATAGGPFHRLCNRGGDALDIGQRLRDGLEEKIDGRASLRELWTERQKDRRAAGLAEEPLSAADGEALAREAAERAKGRAAEVGEALALAEAQIADLGARLGEDGWAFPREGAEASLSGARQRGAIFFLRWAIAYGQTERAVRVPGVVEAAARDSLSVVDSQSGWCMDAPWHRSFWVSGKTTDTPKERLAREAEAREALLANAQGALDALEEQGAALLAQEKGGRNHWLARMIAWLEPERVGRAVAQGAGMAKLGARARRAAWAMWLESASISLDGPGASREGSPEMKRLRDSLDAALAAGLGLDAWQHRSAEAPAPGPDGEPAPSWANDELGGMAIRAGERLGPAKTKKLLSELAARGVDLGADFPSLIAVGAASSGRWAPDSREKLLRWAFGAAKKPPRWGAGRWANVWGCPLLQSTESLRLLRELGVQIHAPLVETITRPGPLYLAMRAAARANQLEELVLLGASLSERTLDARGPVHQAADREDGWAQESLEWALGRLKPAERKLAANEPDINGVRPLHLAVRALNAPAIDALAAAGAVAQVKDKRKGEGLVATLSRRYGSAAEAKMPGVVDALQRLGVDWLELDKQGRQALARLAKRAPAAALEKIAKIAPEAFAEDGKSMAFKESEASSAQDVLALRGGQEQAIVEGELLRQESRKAARGEGSQDISAPAPAKRGGRRI
jgi:hypothetical protein